MHKTIQSFYPSLSPFPEVEGIFDLHPRHCGYTPTHIIYSTNILLIQEAFDNFKVTEENGAANSKDELLQANIPHKKDRY